MSDTPLISILIPMFNAEETIARCLDSVITQEPQIYEILIVDDGSADTSCQIVQQYAEKYPAVTVLRQANSGVAAARQKLIQSAKGEYIMFLDADDYFEPNVIQTVYQNISADTSHSIDVFIYGYNLVRTFGNKNIMHRQLREGIHTKSEIAKHHINGLHDLYYSVLWNKCYKASICKSPEITFEKHFEDGLFNLDYFGKCSQIAVCEKTIYNYVQIGESLTRNSHSEKKPKDNTNAIRGNVETYQTMTNKALAAYPSENMTISEYIYMQMVRVKKQNSSADINAVPEFTEMFKKLKKQLGFRTARITLKAAVYNTKQKCKAIAKGILTKIKKG
ncbi:MAG: glycosyltransferase family 2 protein [Spirochaetales bacterium]|nr:glycosyltransferase family 2 protein [Spirochaetales bacterium]